MVPFRDEERPLSDKHFLSPIKWRAMKSRSPISYEGNYPIFGVNVDTTTAVELLKSDHRYIVTGVGCIAFTADHTDGRRIVATVYPDE